MTAVYGWLTQRPVAHRGLHDLRTGVAENSVSAARAAARKGFAIECDVRLSGDGEPMVFHDDDLGRLTDARGPFSARTAIALGRLPLTGASDAIPTLRAFLEAAGDAPVMVEIKSAFDGDRTLARRVAAMARAHGAPIALKSFDPGVMADLRDSAAAGPGVPLGMIAQARFDDEQWSAVPPRRRAGLAALADYAAVRPDFLSWKVDDLPHAAPTLFRAALGAPVLAWTVRTPAQRARARRFADQIIFEGAALADDAAIVQGEGISE